MTAILGDLDAILRSGQHPYRTMDWLHSVTEMEWARCAKILNGLGAVVDGDAVEMLAGARQFWELFAELRRVHTNAVRLGHVESAEGDWAFVEAGEIPNSLPEMHVPKMHRRTQYLVRVTRRCGPLWTLDFHSMPNYRGLFRVPI